MIWLLDTNVVTEAAKPDPDANCQSWLEARVGQCALSSITVAEMRFGIERLPTGKKKAQPEREFDFLAEDYQGRFYEFDGPAAYEWGRYAAELEGMIWCRLVEAVRFPGHAACRHRPGIWIDHCDAQCSAFSVLPNREPF